MSTNKNAQKNNFLMPLTMVLSISAFGFISSFVSAEVLQLPEVKTPPVFTVTLPGRGMTMTEVVAKFGEPLTKEAEVGKPPITRWIYPDYIVVFESQYVIHALTTKKPFGFMAPEKTVDSNPNNETTEKTESVTPMVE